MRDALAAILLMLAASPAAADVPAEFCSDRPGLTTGTCTAAAGTWQLETSFAEWSHFKGAEELAIGSSRLRYGLSGRTDVHLALTPYLRVREDKQTLQGVDDLSIALKHLLTSREAPIAIAVMPVVKLPTGSRAVSNRKWEGALLVPIEAPLSGRWSLTLTPEIGWNADGDGHGYHGRYSLAATLGVDLSNRWSASIDALIGRERDGEEVSREAVASVSLAFLSAPTVQLDAQADIGLTRDTPGIKLTTGIAFRF